MDSLIFLYIVAFALFGITFFLFLTFFSVEQQTIAVIERFGKFLRLAKPGLRCRIPFIDNVAGRLSLRVLQIDVPVETKTHDNVFVNLMIAIQYRVLDKRLYEAFYMLDSPDEQIRSFVFDAVRAQVPTLILDDVFSKKDDIANAVRRDLREQMGTFGYEIIKVLVVDIQPDAQVKQAMNEINTAQRLRIAAQEKGEAEKVIRVKQAEADAEASILHGKGIAGQRREIIEGLSTSVEEMSRLVPNLATGSIMEMVMLSQYLDMMKEVGASSKTSVLFVPHGPQNMADIGGQIRDVMFGLDAVKDKQKE
jgi:regulator of protease activity HflC (stomatin/prohibitin superfamily)